MSGPTSRTRSSCVEGRCMPVAIRMVTAERGIPTVSMASRMGGRISRFGAGRVISLITTQAFFLPLLISLRGFDWMGRPRLSAMALKGSRTGSGSDGSRTPTKPGVAPISTGTPSVEYFNVTFTRCSSLQRSSRSSLLLSFSSVRRTSYALRRRPYTLYLSRPSSQREARSSLVLHRLYFGGGTGIIPGKT